METYSSKEHILAALQKGVRLDGRKLDEFRPVTIETGVSATAEGSARVCFGDMEVIAGVKMGFGTPYSDKPDEGVLIVNAELLPMSNPALQSGPPSIDAIEISRVIDRGIRESQTIDTKTLCITPGEAVWMVNVDVCPINANGWLIDIGALAAIAALRSAKIPELKDGKPDYKNPGKKKLPVSGEPIPVTVIKIGDVFLVDPTDIELRVADARITLTSEEDGTLCALQKGGDSPLMIDEIEKMFDLAVEKSKELRKILDKALK